MHSVNVNSGKLSLVSMMSSDVISTMACYCFLSDDFIHILGFQDDIIFFGICLILYTTSLPSYPVKLIIVSNNSWIIRNDYLFNKCSLILIFKCSWSNQDASTFSTSVGGFSGICWIFGILVRNSRFIRGSAGVFPVVRCGVVR